MHRKLVTLLILGLALVATFSIGTASAHPDQAEDNGITTALDNAGVNPMIAVLDTPAAGGAGTDAIEARVPTCGAHPVGHP